MHCAVIGHPAAHSLSPAIHRAGYLSCGLNWHYEAIDVAPAALGDFIAGCRSDDAWAGLSVTAPHKDAIVQFGEPDEPTRLLGCAMWSTTRGRRPSASPLRDSTVGHCPGSICSLGRQWTSSRS